MYIQYSVLSRVSVVLYLRQPIGEGCEATRAERGNGAVTASGLVEGFKLKRPQGRRGLASLSSGLATSSYRFLVPSVLGEKTRPIG